MRQNIAVHILLLGMMLYILGIIAIGIKLFSISQIGSLLNFFAIYWLMYAFTLAIYFIKSRPRK